MLRFRLEVPRLGAQGCIGLEASPGEIVERSRLDCRKPLASLSSFRPVSPRADGDGCFVLDWRCRGWGHKGVSVWKRARVRSLSDRVLIAENRWRRFLRFDPCHRGRMVTDASFSPAGAAAAGSS